MKRMRDIIRLHKLNYQYRTENGKFVLEFIFKRSDYNRLEIDFFVETAGHVLIWWDVLLCPSAAAASGVN